jgi:hypothetical protein
MNMEARDSTRTFIVVFLAVIERKCVARESELRAVKVGYTDQDDQVHEPALAERVARSGERLSLDAARREQLFAKSSATPAIVEYVAARFAAGGSTDKGRRAKLPIACRPADRVGTQAGRAAHRLRDRTRS